MDPGAASKRANYQTTSSDAVYGWIAISSVAPDLRGICAVPPTSFACPPPPAPAPSPPSPPAPPSPPMGSSCAPQANKTFFCEPNSRMCYVVRPTRAPYSAAALDCQRLKGDLLIPERPQEQLMVER